MNLQSIKSRFLGSYLFIILLLVIQLPIIYFLVGGMTKKYSQIEEAGTLRKRAVELNYILNRHILNGEEELEKPFQAQKAEFTRIIEDIRNGNANAPAIKDRALLAKLDNVKDRWDSMRSTLDEAMASGDKLTDVITEIEKTTPAMVEKLNSIVTAFVALKDPSYTKSVNLAGLQRMRTVNIAYLMERYSRSNTDIETVASGIKGTIKDFEETLAGLKNGSAALGLKAVHDRELLARLNEAEGLWIKRKAMIEEGMKARDAFRGKMTELSSDRVPQMIAASTEFINAISASGRSSAMSGLAFMAVTIMASIALAVFFLWSTSQHIIAPILKVKDTVDNMANGDLTKRAAVKVRFLGKELNDEITGLGASVDEMASQMSMVIGRITDSSALLASASEQLSASAVQIDDGANRQSSQTAQVATSMEEMNATVVEVAKNTHSVSESAKNTQGIAAKGGDVVKQAIAAMQEVAESTSVTADTVRSLGKSSEEIGTIVSVINDIADQTNLLALNAAIEAARAGEQGRGFAVVADEVRKLAERTTKATKEISTMICAIQDETGKAVTAMAEGTAKVENGVKLANEAGESLGRIVVGVQGVSDMISHIATSTEEQSATTDEISRNMDSIAEVAKSNVGAVGEVSKATSEMARLATELKEMVSRFRCESEPRRDVSRKTDSTAVVPSRAAAAENVTPISLARLTGAA